MSRSSNCVETNANGPAPGVGPSRVIEPSSGVPEIRGCQLAALAHHVVGELLPLVQAAHSRALDCGNVNEHVLAAVVRLDEAESLLCIEELDCALCHLWPPLKTLTGVLRAARHRAALRPNPTLSWEEPGGPITGQVKSRTVAYIMQSNAKSTHAL